MFKKYKLVYPGGFLSGNPKSVYPTASFGIFTHNCPFIWSEFTLEKKKGEGMNQAEFVVWQTLIIIKMSDS